MYRTARPHQLRRGFTLIEVLIVVTILAILIALLVPAVQSSIRTVRITAVQTDIGILSTAVTSFKTKYGTEPPSTIVLCEKATDWNNNANASSKAYIRQLWPQFNFAIDRDLDGDGTVGETPGFPISGGECLVFFLGGMPSPSSSGFSLVPFTRNPADPFSRANNANREKPVFEFNSIRFSDINNNGFPEYKDPFPGQRSPYIYFSTYDGAGYRTVGTTNEFQGLPNPMGGIFPSSPYRNGATETSEPFNPRTFQLISPGPDGEYGPGGPYVAGATTPLPAWPVASPTYTLKDRNYERDNVTNFGSGMLAP